MLGQSFLSHNRYCLIHSSTSCSYLPLKINDPICKLLSLYLLMQIICIQRCNCCNNCQSWWRWHSSSNRHAWLCHNAHTYRWWQCIFFILQLPLCDSFKALNKIISPMHLLQKFCLWVVGKLKVGESNALYISKLYLWRFVSWDC